MLEKKENALIIHSAMETWKYAIIRLSEISSFYLYALFRKFRTSSEPAKPLFNFFRVDSAFISTTMLQLPEKIK